MGKDDKPQPMTEAPGLVRRFPEFAASKDDIAFVNAMLGPDDKPYGPAVYVKPVADVLRERGRIIRRDQLAGVVRSCLDVGGDPNLNIAHVQNQGWFFVPRDLIDALWDAINDDLE
jgi:hypothetical protein